ncbi:MAG: LptF/LptG family permease [Alphaproteobacteria bacterium]
MLNRYIFGQLALTFVILVSVLTGLVWVSQIVRLLKLVIERGRTIGEFLQLTGAMVPWIAGMVAPGSLLIATIYVLNRINADNELVIVHAAGTSRWYLLKPFVLVAMLVTGFVVFVNLYAMPLGLRYTTKKIIEARTDIIATLVQEGQFVTPENGLMVHIKAKGPKGDMLGLVFRDSRTPGATVTYLAERARIVETAGANATTLLVMYRGTVLRRRGSPQELDVVKFEEYSLDLKEFGAPKDITYQKATHKFLGELLNPDPKDRYYLSDPNNNLAEAHDRMSNPLYVLAMMLVAFVGMSRARSTRTNAILLILVVASVGFGLRILGVVVNNLIASTGEFVFLAYLAPLAGMGACLTWMVWQSLRFGRSGGRETRGPGAQGATPGGPGAPASLALGLGGGQ